MTGLVVAGLGLTPLLAAVPENPSPATPPAQQPPAGDVKPNPAQGQHPAEPKSEEAKSVQPEVQSQIEKQSAEKRAALLKDAQAALEETHKALDAITAGKKADALAALERASGKLDLLLSREPKVALAPVSALTTVHDLYSKPETIRNMLKTAKDSLADGKVQEARALLAELISEADIHVINIPLATYPAAIKSVAPLIDAGKMDEAKSTLQAALNTLVLVDVVIPLPPIRAQAMLSEAEKLTEKSGRNEEENKKLHNLVEAVRNELQLGELLGYGSKTDYKPLYGMLDEIQKKTEGGKFGKGFFGRINAALQNIKSHLFG